MKRLSLIMGVVALLLLIGCTTTERSVSSKLYGISSQYREDIRGNFTVESLLLYRKITLSTNSAVVLERYRPDAGEIFYTFKAMYLGGDWRFMREIHIKTDGNLYSLEDRTPVRDVLSGGTVQEIVTVILPEKAIADLSSTSTLILQYWIDPIPVPAEGVEAVRGFLLY